MSENNEENKDVVQTLRDEGLPFQIDEIEKSMDKIKTHMEDVRNGIGKETYTEFLAGKLVGIYVVINAIEEMLPDLLSEHGIKSNTPKVWDVEDILWIDDGDD